MRLLLDTHILIWSLSAPSRLSRQAQALIQDAQSDLAFSAVAIWEVAIKQGLNRADFDVEPRVLQRELLERGYLEIPITGAHGAGVQHLPSLHRDPFDRIMIAQAIEEGRFLLSADRVVLQYGQPTLAV